MFLLLYGFACIPFESHGQRALRPAQGDVLSTVIECLEIRVRPGTRATMSQRCALARYIGRHGGIDATKAEHLNDREDEYERDM